jgi:hypothetical protein
MHGNEERLREDEERVVEDRELLQEGAERLREDEEHLQEDREREHGTVAIVVNGRPKELTEDEVSFEQVVHLAFSDAGDVSNSFFTVTYHHGPRGQVEGSLVAGQSVHVKNGMIFNVSRTDKS